jgi:uncharacterized protein YoxC
MLLTYSAGSIADVALAVFLVVVGLALGWALIRLAGVFSRLSSLIRGAEREVLPVINKAGGSVDRVNLQLDKIGEATDSAVDAVEAVDQAVRTVSFAVKRPIEKLAGVSAGLAHGFASFRTKRNWKDAVATGKQAAARREADLEQELRRKHE